MRPVGIGGTLAGGALAALLWAGLCVGAGAEAAKAVAPAKSAAAKAPPAKASDTAAKSDSGKPGDTSNAGPFPTKSKDPIYITADRLDIFDKEGRAVYSGPSGVVVTQGPSKVVGTELTAYYDRQHDNPADKSAAGGQAQPAQPQQSGIAGSSVKRILVKGPVSVVQNDQVATGDDADFDRVQNIVILTGHVSLTQGPNVTTGDKLVYNLNTGVANVYSAPGTPVKSLFVQGSQGPGDAKGDAKDDAKGAAPLKAGAGKSAAKPAPGKTAKSQ